MHIYTIGRKKSGIKLADNCATQQYKRVSKCSIKSLLTKKYSQIC